MKRRTEITIETDRLLVLDRHGGHARNGSHESHLETVRLVLLVRRSRKTVEY